MRTNILKKTPPGRGRALPGPDDGDAIAFRTSLLALNAAVEASCRNAADISRDPVAGAAPLRLAPVRATRPVERNDNGV